jgi:hypothetical protein
MEKVTSIREGVEKLLKLRGREVPEFTFENRQEGGFTPTLLWDGNVIPLFTTRYDPRIRHIAGYGNKTEENSALNVYSFVGSDVSLDRLIYRELCIAEFILHSKVKKITAFVNQNAANIIAVMEDNTTANIDLGNTMAPGSHNQCQHRGDDAGGVFVLILIHIAYVADNAHDVQTQCGGAAQHGVRDAGDRGRNGVGHENAGG